MCYTLYFSIKTYRTGYLNGHILKLFQFRLKWMLSDFFGETSILTAADHSYIHIDNYQPIVRYGHVHVTLHSSY